MDESASSLDQSIGAELDRRGDRHADRLRIPAEES
jgi:hypothetical protein